MRYLIIILGLFYFSLSGQTPDSDRTRIRDGIYMTYYNTMDTAWIQSQPEGFLFYVTDNVFNLLPAGGEDPIVRVVGMLGITDVRKGTNDSVLIIESGVVKKRYLDFAGVADTSLWELNGNDLYPKSVNYIVGIGTTNPSDKLHLYDAGNSVSFKIEQVGLTDGYFSFDVTSNANGVTTTANQEAISGFSVINFSPLSTDPTKSHVISFFRNTTANAGQAEFRIFKGDNSNSIQSLFEGDGNSYLNALSGDVGIGTATPGFKLDVWGNLGIRSVIDADDIDSVLLIDNFEVKKRYLNFDLLAGVDTIWTSAGTEAYTRDWVTMVGIGTSNPSELLELAGGNFEIPRWYKIIQGDTNLIKRWKTSYFIGSQNTTNTGLYNTFVGYYSGFANTTGYTNTGIGQDALQNNTIGYNNVGTGRAALHNNTSGNYNTSSGFQSSNSNTTGSYNVAIGANANSENTSGNSNVVIGYEAGAIGLSHSKIGSVYLGYKAGYNDTMDYNVFIGYQAAYNETGGNLLYIENSNSVTPLIYGDFAIDSLAVNGTITCDSIYTIKAGAWADYVFEENYNLVPFKTEIEWIKNNGHLRSLQKANSDKYITNLNLQRRLEGAIEEIEKLYLYIEQLEKRISEK